jgi:PucR-like helix-turn-helix protein
MATIRAQDRSPSLQERPWESLPGATADALRPHLPATAEEVIEAIRAGVPAYARPLEGAFGEGIRTGVEQALAQFVELVGRGSPAPPAGRDVYFELGRGEVREGRTMEALLAAYRVGARAAWRRAAVVCREAGFDAKALALLAESIFAYIDELSARSAEGFAFEQSVVAGEAARRRRALIALLVQSPPAEPAAIEAAAREAPWELPAALAAVAWRDDPHLRAASRLPYGSIAAVLEDGVACGLVPDPGAPGRLAEVERALGQRRAAVGPSVPWREAWRSTRRAQAALRLAADGVLSGDGAIAAEEHLADLVVHGDPALLDELAERRLAPLASRSETSRARLLETLRAWLDHQGRVPEVARALHVHPQTVRYRVAQLRELFGDALDDPVARLELALAVRAPERRRATRP